MLVKILINVLEILDRVQQQNVKKNNINKNKHMYQKIHVIMYYVGTGTFGFLNVSKLEHHAQVLLKTFFPAYMRRVALIITSNKHTRSQYPSVKDSHIKV